MVTVAKRERLAIVPYAAPAKTYKLDETNAVKIGVGKSGKFGPGRETFLAKLAESFKKPWNLLCRVVWFLPLIWAYLGLFYIFGLCCYVAANPKLVVKGVFALGDALPAYLNFVARSLLEQIKEKFFERLR